jgi:hypothetical protein
MNILFVTTDLHTGKFETVIVPNIANKAELIGFVVELFGQASEVSVEFLDQHIEPVTNGKTLIGWKDLQEDTLYQWMILDVVEPSKDVVYSQAVNVTTAQLQKIVDVLSHDVYEDEQPLSIDEVLNNPQLLDYICSNTIEDGVALYDPHEAWNNDCWCEWKDYR